jgi:hypothetical protein
MLMKTTSAMLLALLASPALAQSQGGTGVGGALADMQAGYTGVRQQIDELWAGDVGRVTKYGIGLYGVGAALWAAREAVGGLEGSVSFSNGSPQVSIGAGSSGTDDDGATATTTTTTATTTSP